MAVTLALVTALGFEGVFGLEDALGLDATFALKTRFGLERLLRFAAIVDLGIPLGLAIAFDLEAFFWLTLEATFPGVLGAFLRTEAFFFLDLSFLSLLDFMDSFSEKDVRRLTSDHIRPVIKALIS